MAKGKPVEDLTLRARKGKRKFGTRGGGMVFWEYSSRLSSGSEDLGTATCTGCDTKFTKMSADAANDHAHRCREIPDWSCLN